MSLKEGPLASETGKKLIRREINNTLIIRHQNVVLAKDVVFTENNVYLVMEFCSGGNLKDKIKSRGGRLNENEARYYI